MFFRLSLTQATVAGTRNSARDSSDSSEERKQERQQEVFLVDGTGRVTAVGGLETGPSGNLVARGGLVSEGPTVLERRRAIRGGKADDAVEAKNGRTGDGSDVGDRKGGDPVVVVDASIGTFFEVPDDGLEGSPNELRIKVSCSPSDLVVAVVIGTDLSRLLLYYCCGQCRRCRRATKQRSYLVQLTLVLNGGRDVWSLVFSCSSLCTACGRPVGVFHLSSVASGHLSRHSDSSLALTSLIYVGHTLVPAARTTPADRAPTPNASRCSSLAREKRRQDKLSWSTTATPIKPREPPSSLPGRNQRAPGQGGQAAKGHGGKLELADL